MKTIERLSVYRRMLAAAQAEGRRYVLSRQLAEQTGGTASQVRRDFMVLGRRGHPKRGYETATLLHEIAQIMDNPRGEAVALVGVGNIGCALLPFLAGYYPNMKVVAAFDSDPRKTGRTIHGCRCHPVEEMELIIKDRRITVAILATPAGVAQALTDRLVACGVRAILSFAPLPLRAPPEVHIERVDIAMALEKAVFFARQAAPKEPKP